MTTSKSYQAGYDAGLNGANTTNAGYQHFQTTEDTLEWERGHKAGKKQKANDRKKVKKHNPRKK